VNDNIQINNDALRQLYQAGRYQEAILAARQCISQQPENSFAWLILTEALRVTDQHAKALTAAQRLIELCPEQAWVYQLAGVLAQCLKQFTMMADYYRQALSYDSENAESYCNLGIAMTELQRYETAEQMFREALQRQPNFTAAQTNLGIVLAKMERYEEAITVHQQTLTLDPSYAVAYRHLGDICQCAAVAHYQEAEHYYRRALALTLDPTVVRSLAQLYIQSGRFSDAQRQLQQICQRFPDDYASYNDLALLEQHLGHFEQALAHYEYIMQHQPDDAKMRSNFANLLADFGRFDEAYKHHQTAITLDPDDSRLHTNFGCFFLKQGLITQAHQCFQQALICDPKNAQARSSLAALWLDLGQPEKALADCQQALTDSQFSPKIISIYLFLLAHSGCYSPIQERQEAERCITRLTSSCSPSFTAYTAPSYKTQQRPRRLGILSAEFGVHAVAYFLLPWLRALSPTEWSLYCYSTVFHEPEKTKPFRDLTPHWCSIMSHTDMQAVEQIRADQLDILIETSGHTEFNRLPLIAHRVAPVQAHYIGYFATTGIRNMDYFIADAVLIPPEQDDHFTETVWRLPRSRYVYMPLETAPDPHWQPDPQGRICFGSFNNLNKLSTACLQLWARVLHAIPTAYLLLKDKKAQDPDLQQRILTTFHAEGISQDRIEWIAYTPSWSDHMALYHRVDIALDTIPFNSATTGFDALWMGVPLLTLIGDRLIGRQAASLLSGLKRYDWIATTPDDYIAKAIFLAQACEQRRQWRYTQRQEMRASELCDDVGLARLLSETFEQMIVEKRQ
jgi:predicted O-linked N-acetylglucosamine transferase (SPINDLY family)